MSKKESLKPLVKKGKDNLRCELTDDEMLEYGKQQSRELSEIKRLEGELKSFTTAHKNKVAEVEARINIISEKINNGYEFRFVETEIITDFETELVSFYRKDTDVCYRQRPLNEEERQLILETKEDVNDN